MCAVVTPSARQCGPPELLATLPPIEQLCWLLGSGAKCRPCTDTARVRSRLSTPGSTHASRLTGSTDSTRFILVVTIMTRRRAASRRRRDPVPAPRATNGRPWRTAIAHARLHLVGAWSGSTPRRHDPRCSTRRACTSASSVSPTRTRSGDSAAPSSATRSSVMPGDDRRSVASIADLLEHDHLAGLDRPTVDQHLVDRRRDRRQA